jgi:hypothetical protein
MLRAVIGKMCNLCTLTTSVRHTWVSNTLNLFLVTPWKWTVILLCATKVVMHSNPSWRGPEVF